MHEVRKVARGRMRGYCRVCRVCDGRACAGEVPGMGGVFMSNLQALAAVKFNMRLIHEVVEPETRCAFLGQTLELPLLTAPIGGVAFSVAAVGGMMVFHSTFSRWPDN